MNDFLEILKYVIPAAIVLLVCYLVIQKFMENEQKKQAMQLRRKPKNDYPCSFAGI